MIAGKRPVSEHTRALILERALKLFREDGFDATTMRGIAESAQLALGAAYYYFPSKEAIVAAYYDHVQEQHEERVRERLAGVTDLHERLSIVFHTKLDILKDDRKFLGALFRFTGDPDHPLSVLGRGTQMQRARSVGILQQTVADLSEVSEELRAVLPVGLWVMHLGAILFFIYDNSPEQRRTRAVVDGALDLLAQLLKLASAPLVRTILQPIQGKLVGILKEAGWVQES